MGGVKKGAIFSASDVVDAMAEAHRMLAGTADKVFRGDDFTALAIKTAIDEYEYVFWRLMGLD